MKTYIKNILTAFVASFALVACEGDEPFFGEEIFNDDTLVPLVMIFDLNEDLENITGNNFWNFTLTPTEDGNSVEIRYDSQDTNILFHEVHVGFASDSDVPQEGDVILTTIESFPVDLTFTKEQVAAALGVTLDELEAEGSVFFRGFSRDADGNEVSDPNVFEDFLAFERHGYFYEWPL